jgi:DNA-binding beta-propeller fold protein YncE
MKNVIGAAVIGVAMAATACAPGDPCEDLESGHACTWLGVEDSEGFNGDHLRWETRVNQVQDLEFLPDGTAWFTDFNNYLVRKVLPDGTVESVVGWTDPIFPGDGLSGGIIPPDGAPGAEWQLNHPTSLLLKPDGLVLLVAWHNHKLLDIDPDSGMVKVVCGGQPGFAGDGGAASRALFWQMSDATMDEAGNTYVVDMRNQRVRMIDTEDIVSTIAGTGTAGYVGDTGPALDAQFSWEPSSNPPSGGILYHEGKLYVSDTRNDAIRVIDLATGIIDGFAGTGEPGYSGDGGPAVDAQIYAPRDLEIGPDGDLYFADTSNHAVRAIDLDTQVIRTVVGTGEEGLGEERLLATETMLRRPFGLAFDPDGNLYVMDSVNSRIVKVAR